MSLPRRWRLCASTSAYSATSAGSLAVSGGSDRGLPTLGAPKCDPERVGTMGSWIVAAMAALLLAFAAFLISEERPSTRKGTQ